MDCDDYIDIPPSEMEYENFVRETNDLNAVINGHLLTEQLLVLAIAKCNTEMDLNRICKMPYSQKIVKAVESGAISESDSPAFQRLNRIRNRFAHSRRSYFSTEDADELYEALSPSLALLVGRMPCDLDTSLHLLKHVVLALCRTLSE